MLDFRGIGLPKDHPWGALMDGIRLEGLPSRPRRVWFSIAASTVLAVDAPTSFGHKTITETLRSFG
jgi:hypothetical protein